MRSKEGRLAASPRGLAAGVDRTIRGKVPKKRNWQQLEVRESWSSPPIPPFSPRLPGFLGGLLGGGLM